jgi:Flp pilus assembly protein TadD
MQEMAEHHYANAIASFRNAARQNPEWPRPWLGLAQVAELQHNDAEVRSALNKASALSPNDPEVTRAWALYNFKKGDLGAAETAFKHAAELEPSAARLTDLGDLYAFQGRTAEAIATYRAAIAKDGSRAGIHFALANMLARQQQWEDARKEFEATLRFSPNNELGIQGLAASLAAQKRFEEAEQVYRSAMLNKHQSASLDAELGTLYLTENKPAEAVAQLRTAAEFDPKIPGIQTRIGAACELIHDAAGAERAYRSAIAANSKDSVALNNLASLLISQNQKTGEAVQRAMSAVSLEPKVGIYYDTLGWAYRANGNHAQAALALKKAAALSSDNAMIWYHNGVVLEEAGQKRQAATAFVKALQAPEKNSWIQDAQTRLAALKAALAVEGLAVPE